MEQTETYRKQWEPREELSTSIPASVYDELADILCREAMKGADLRWADGTPVFDNDTHTEEVQK